MLVLLIIFMVAAPLATVWTSGESAESFYQYATAASTEKPVLSVGESG